MADTARAAALSAAVAMATARLDGVEVDPATLLDGLDQGQAIDALTWLAAMLAEHAVLDTGPMMLQVIGRVAAYVDSRAADDG